MPRFFLILFPSLGLGEIGILAFIETKKKLMGIVLKWLSLDSLIPKDIFIKLYQPIEPILVYRVVD